MPLPCSGGLGVRTAKRTHSRSAMRAGTAPDGWGTSSCGRPKLGFANALITHGGAFASPLSPISSPWFGSNVLCAGGGVWQFCGWASGPGPETLRMLSSKSSTSSKIAE